MGLTGKIKVHTASAGRLSAPKDPMRSEGTLAIIDEAMRTDSQLPLFVTVGGGLTEVASAVMLEPSIADRFTLVWIGGGRPHPEGAKAVLVQDPAVEAAARLFRKLDLALVGIGSLEPSSLLASSGNIFSVQERKQLRRSGAVGDICFQFIDKQGGLVESSLMERVIGIDLPTLKRTSRVVGIAAGQSKVAAILASVKGKWVNVLITDRHTAELLVSSSA